jgi:hypothetical protein
MEEAHATHTHKTGVFVCLIACVGVLQHTLAFMRDWKGGLRAWEGESAQKAPPREVEHTGSRKFVGEA